MSLRAMRSGGPDEAEFRVTNRSLRWLVGIASALLLAVVVTALAN